MRQRSQWTAFRPTEVASGRVLMMDLQMMHAAVLFLLISLTAGASASAASSGGLALLLNLKATLVDPSGMLDDWSASVSPCNWRGIICSPDNSTIVGLNFSRFGLAGSLEDSPSNICSGGNLPNLTIVDLSNNSLSGPFPSQLLQCTRLQHLSLSSNFYTGTLPQNVDLLGASLQTLDLSYNTFSGSIPEAFGRLPRLVELDLFANQLNATIPSHLGQLTSLQYLRLAYNPFAPGFIPPELGNLSALVYIWLPRCSLEGPIPPTLGNLLHLSNLDLSFNRLTGAIPASIFNLKMLYQLELYNNELLGQIPNNIGNLTGIANLDLSMNQLTGYLPPSITQLQNLQSLNLYSNQLSGSLPEGLQDLPALTTLSLFNNSFTGPLPQRLGRASSQLQVMDVSNNQFQGALPPYACAGGVLEVLVIMNNRFNGSIPPQYGECRSLHRLRMGNNQLSGSVPPGLWGLPSVSIIELHNNNLQGSITSDIRNAVTLSTMRLDNNRLSGSLPDELGDVRNLTLFSISHNLFSGSIPAALGKLVHLSDMDFHFNSFSGAIPEELASCNRMTVLNIAGNQLSGSIPTFLDDLPIINTIDLSHNLLTGEIPPSLAELRLVVFDVSYNRLSGEVPAGFAGGAFESSFKGNEGLCGKGFTDVRGCAGRADGRGGHSKWASSAKLLQAVLAATFATAFLLLAGGLVCLYRLHKPLLLSILQLQRRSSSLKKFGQWSSSSWSLVSFYKLGFSEYDILKGLDEDNVIGSGGSGRVYKTTLKNGETVAIKKLWNCSSIIAYDGDESFSPAKGSFDPHHADRGFKAEVSTLGKIRHKNIVKLLCCCSNDKLGIKLLVYEYMPNGSLGDLLHGGGGAAAKAKGQAAPQLLLLQDWASRYKVAVGAAQGLAYLHHDCCPPIVHRDVKSNNILLDAHLNAHVADFGVAKVMQQHCSTASTDQEKDSASLTSAHYQQQHHHQKMQGHSLFLSSCNIAGSYGYIAPEHAYTAKVTEKSDIYSFGVVLLELVTGKKPVAPEVFGENTDLVKWVCNKLSSTTTSGQVKSGDILAEVLDSRLADTSKEDMLLVLRIGLMCTAALPSSRPSMREVVDMLVRADPHRQRWIKRTGTNLRSELPAHQPAGCTVDDLPSCTTSSDDRQELKGAA